MSDSRKTREELIRELAETRKQNAELIAAVARLKKETEPLRKKEKEARETAEIELEKTRFNLQEAQKVACLGGWEYIAENHETIWSEELYRIYGVDSGKQSPNYESLIEHHVHPDDAAMFDAKFRSSLEEGAGFDVERRIVRPDGSVRVLYSIWKPNFDKAGKLVGYIGVTQDITERKQAEEELKVSLTKYRVLFDSFPLGITITDKNGHIVEGNRKSEELLGISQGEHVKRTIDGQEWRIVRTDGTPMPADEYASTIAMKENRVVENMEMGIVKSDGTTWINVTAAPIPLEGFGVAITYGDITERKKTEIELEGRSRELEEMNIALRVVLKQREEDKAHFEMNVIANHKVSVLPYIELLERTGLDNNQKTFLSIIKSNLDVITSAFSRKMAADSLGLTANELKVASLIREGRTSKEISGFLNISITTVHAYRWRIRQKTKLKNTNVNLRSYLQSLS